MIYHLPDCCHEVPATEIPPHLKTLAKEGWVVATCDHNPGELKLVHQRLSIHVFKCKHCPQFHVFDREAAVVWNELGAAFDTLSEALANATARVRHAADLGHLTPTTEHPFHKHMGDEWPRALRDVHRACRVDILAHVSGLVYIRMSPEGYEVFNPYLERDNEVVVCKTIGGAIRSARAYLARVKQGISRIPDPVHDFVRDRVRAAIYSTYGGGHRGGIVGDDLLAATLEFVAAKKIAEVDEEELASCFQDGWSRHLDSIGDVWTGPIFVEERYYRLMEIDNFERPWVPGD